MAALVDDHARDRRRFGTLSSPPRAHGGGESRMVHTIFTR